VLGGLGSGQRPDRAVQGFHEIASGEAHVLLGPADRLMPGEQTTVRALPGSPMFFDADGAGLAATSGLGVAAHRETAYGT
jgi:hypothetical protein